MANHKKLGKNKHKKHKRTTQPNLPGAVSTWQENDGLHSIVAGERPSEEKLADMTRTYQRQLKKSPLFKQWVAKFGKEKALELLEECRVELR